jgi:guanyl-specific ribonuclease Sa
MPKWTKIALLLAVLFAVLQWIEARPPQLAGPANGGDAVDTSAANGSVRTGRYPAFLPPEAVATLEQIGRGGPFPYGRDGSVFQNRERRLPDQPRGYYREYTVATPGAPDRGARRIVTGGQPPEVYYYTDDHYRSFRRVEIER